MMDLKEVFSEWYSVVDPGFSGEKIGSRLAAIEKITGSMAVKDLVDLALLFYKQTPKEEFIGRIRVAIRDTDASYVSHDLAELAIAAAGVFYLLFNKPGPVASTAALLLVSGEYGGLRGAKRVDAVIVRAREYLQQEGSRVREQALIFPNLAELLKGAAAKLKAATKERAAGEAEADVRTSLDIQGDTVAALKSYAAAIAASLDLLEKRRLEESSVLYWLLGSRSLATEEPFEAIHKPRLAFLAAHELASQTQHIPGPVSARSILRSVIEHGKGTTPESSTKGCIGKLISGDGERLLKSSKAYAPVFMPLTFALEKNREVGGGHGWENAFSVQTKMDAQAMRDLVEIAEQFYRECLLSRLLNEAPSA
jgi:GTPase-associated system helical domain